MKTGIELIAEERTRQIEEEGWTAEHDDIANIDQELAFAAACYAIPEGLRNLPMAINPKLCLRELLWSWAEEWWKPTPDKRIRELTKAGALIAAEIDRIQRERGES